MNEIAINPVTIKVIPIPLSGAGMFEYFSFSRIAAIPTIASNQPIPEPKPKAVASPMLAYPLSCMNRDAPMMAQFTAINGRKIPNWL